MRPGVFASEQEQQLWLDVTQRNPKREGETFWDWMDRLTEIMRHKTLTIPAQNVKPAKVEKEEDWWQK